jgi:anti-sigma B factor antagonist
MLPDRDAGASPFGAVVVHADGETVVEVSGELDMATAPVLARRLADLPDGTGRVTLDVSRLEFCDSSGMSVFVDCQRRVAARGGSVVLRRPSDNMRRLLSLTGLDALLETSAVEKSRDPAA